MIVLFFSCGNVYGQIHTGTITGQVTDATTAAVAKAHVQITNVDTKVAADFVTDSAGLYVAPNLLPGHYSVLVSYQGFQPQSKVGLVLSIGQTLSLNFVLRPGAQVETITVVAENAQLLDSTTSTLGEVITEKPVQNLPLNGRDYLDLVPLSAGVTPPPPGGNVYNVNGTRGSGTAYLIDGVDVTGPTNDPVRILPNLEAIGEFKITTNNFDAEYGRSLGGIVNAHIRSGTNAWHGSVFEYFRNTVLDARNFFDTERLPYNFNQFGGSLGGPILRDKLFVFGDYQGVRSRSSVTHFTNVPTVAEDHGDFSDLLPGTIIYDPTTFPRVPFQNNLIPQNRLDPAAALMFSLLPAPNRSGAFNYVAPLTTLDTIDSGDLRIDYNMSAKDRLSGIFVIRKHTNTMLPILGPRLNGSSLVTTVLADRGQTYSLNYSHIVSPAMVNELTLAWSRDVRAGPVTPGMQYEPTLGIPGLNTSPSNTDTTGFPLFDLIGNGYATFGAGLGGPFNQTHNAPQVSDSLSWNTGPHAFKAGFSANFRQFNVHQSLASRGLYIFLGLPTASFSFAGGNSAASALLGYPFEIIRQMVSPTGERAKEYGGYFQDNFKATKRLTLNLGIRWDLYTPATEVSNRIANFDPATVSMVLPNQNGRSASTLDTNYHNISPHTGFSYQATADGKTIVRGGFAIGYMNLVAQDAGSITDRLEENPPFALASTGVYNPLGPQPNLGISVPRVSDGFPLTPQDPQHLCCGVSLIYIPQSQPTPYTEQWNLDIQRALPRDFLFDIAYVGTAGVHLLGTTNINQAPPGPTPAGPRSPFSPNISTIHALKDQNSSIYHSMQVKVERRFSSGFYLMGSYVYSKSIDDGSLGAGSAFTPLASSTQPQDAFNVRGDRGPSDFDVRHRMVISYIYELPFGEGKRFAATSNTILNALIGGWQMNGITSAQSGWPFTPKLANGTAAINAGPGGAVRPNIIGNPDLGSRQTIQHWFNVAAFVAPGAAGTPPFTFGDAGRNILRGPRFVNFDFSLFKTFPVREHLRVEFRSEFFNLFNHPNFGLPNQFVDQPQAGIITSASSPRQIQFALKLFF